MLSAILVGRNTVQNNPEAITARGNSQNYLCPINYNGDFIHIPDTCKISLLENFLLAYFSSYYRGSSSLDIWLHFHALEVVLICQCQRWSNSTLLPPSINKWCKERPSPINASVWPMMWELNQGQYFRRKKTNNYKGLI